MLLKFQFKKQEAFESPFEKVVETKTQKNKKTRGRKFLMKNRRFVAGDHKH